MTSKILAVIVTIIALALAIIVSFIHRFDLGYNVYIHVSRFFDVMIPILAVGALLKYLFSCCHHNHSCKKE